MPNKTVLHTEVNINQFVQWLQRTAVSCTVLGQPLQGAPIQHSWILNDISRNCLLGHKQKIATFLMRTFTCRSTFLYAPQAHIPDSVKVLSFVFSPLWDRCVMYFLTYNFKMIHTGLRDPDLAYCRNRIRFDSRLWPQRNCMFMNSASDLGWSIQKKYPAQELF
jgi:hypothetical protein